MVSSVFAKENESTYLSDQDESLEITYIANAGVFITFGEKKVLIDAHHYRGNPYYERVPWNRLEKMVNGLNPFDRVDLILATHLHADHFDAVSVGKHLLYNPTTKFLASEQMTSLIEKEFSDYSKIEKRIKTVTPGWKFFNETEFDGIAIKVLAMKHGSKRFEDIQNMGYLLRIGKYKLLHIGDADATVENFETFKLPVEGIDFAFIPYWFLTHKPYNQIVDQYIQPGRIMALHIPPEEADEIARKVRDGYPDAIVFTKPLQKVSF